MGWCFPQEARLHRCGRGTYPCFHVAYNVNPLDLSASWNDYKFL